MIKKEIIPSLSNPENPWHKVYWFARMLINTDKYGAIGKDNKLLTELSASLKLISSESFNLEYNEVLKLQKQLILNSLTTKFKNAKSRIARIKTFYEDLDKEILSIEDMNVFILTCDSIVLPINQAIANIPSDDKQFTYEIAKSFLDTNLEKGLATVINLWDDLGVKGCLTAERTEIIKAFATLRIILENMRSIGISDSDIILTAFIQEFERRAAQKRKSRAGTSLEDVTQFILDYFKIKSVTKPEHFQADIEVDNWVKTKDGWLIGISCKRTLRERWKQVSSADASILNKFKIKFIYHVITYDEDLSDDKLTLLGIQRHIFYLPDDSRILLHAQNHIGLKGYVRPMSQFIEDLKKEL